MKLCDICQRETKELTTLTHEFLDHDVCNGCLEDLERRIKIAEKHIDVKRHELRKLAYQQWHDKNFNRAPRFIPFVFAISEWLIKCNQQEQK